MKHDNDWQTKLARLGSEEERQLLQRLQQEDPDLADAMWAKLVEEKLDSIGLQPAPKDLHRRLYAIAKHSNPLNKKPQRKSWRIGGSGLGIAALIMIAVLVQPWQQQPTDAEIAAARQQLAITFYYLNRAANMARQETEASLAYGVKAAVDSSPFIELEAEEENLEL